MIRAALDTTLAPSLALSRDGEVIAVKCLDTTGRHSDRQLAPWLKQTLTSVNLQAHQIQRWTVGTGPGSFSGVRMGIALVQGICAATGAPCRGVPSSVALALAAVEKNPRTDASIAVLHDARRGQLILSRYRWHDQRLQSRGDADVVDPDMLAEELADTDLFVTAQAKAVRACAPDGILCRLLAYPHPEARLLLAPPGWPWPATPAAAMASLAPVYVRPPVFVPPRAHGRRQNRAG